MKPSKLQPYNPDKLRQMRAQVGLSLEVVALTSGLHDKGQISRFERGLVVPLATTLGKVLQVLQPEPWLLYALFGLSFDPKQTNLSQEIDPLDE